MQRQSRPGEQTLIKQAYARGVSLSFCLMDLDVGVTRCHTNGCLADDDRASSRSHSHGQLPDFDSNLFVAVCFYETLLAGLVGSYVLCSLRSYPDTCIISNS